VKERIKPHAASIRTLCVSADGNSVYTGSEDGIIGIFDRRSAQQTGQLRGHSAWITALARAPTIGEAAYGTSLSQAVEDSTSNDALLLLSSSADASIRLWDLRMKECIHSHEQNRSPIWALDWVKLKSGQFVVAGGEDAGLRLFTAPR
jgi:WD40 repeat protein